jgi:LuxR family maltose regulon positive regulatory protein
MSPAYDVPRIRARSIARPRLVDAMLGDGAPSSLTIVHGPAGSGKSTLLAQWAQARPWNDENLVWVTLYPDDAGVVPFWSRVAGTLKQAGVVPSGFSLEATAGDFSAMLLGSLAGLDRPLTLLLDDYHLVAHDSIDRQLRTLLERLDDFAVVIGTRSTGELHSLELAARLGTVLVDPLDLSFTADESEELVTVGGLASHEGWGRIIHNATGGWALASQALLMEAKRESTDGLLRATTPAAGGSAFAREFARSSLAELPENVRTSLLRLSFADETTITLASELTGESVQHTERLLSTLERNGIGTWQTRATVKWFRLHPLLREALEAEAISQLDGKDVRMVRTTLSERLEATRPLHALELAVLIRDWALTERLVLLHWVTFTYYNSAPYTALLSRVPAAAMRTHPGLLGAQLVEDYNVQGADLDAIMRRHDQLISIDEHAPTPTVVGALREMMFAGVHRLYGDLPRSVARSERALAALADSDLAQVRQQASSLPILHTHIAVNHYFDRQTQRAVNEMAVGNDLARRAGSVGEQLQTIGFLAFMHAVRGDLEEARVWIAHGETADPYDGWIGGYLQAPYLIAQALDSLGRWDASSAIATLDLLRFTEPAIEFWPWMASARAYADAIVVGPTAAHAALSATIGRAKQRPTPVASARALLIATEAQLLLLSGQPRRAAAVIEQSGLEGEPEVDLVRARLASLSRNDAVAIDLAVSVVWANLESPAIRGEALLTLASCAYEAGQHDRAVDAFAEAVTTMERTGFRLPLLWLGNERAAQLVALSKEQGRLVGGSVLEGLPDLGQRLRSIIPLTASELRVLSTLRDNGTVAVTAELLFLSPQTVRYHLKQIYRKLGASGRDEAIALAQELGLMDRTR